MLIVQVEKPGNVTLACWFSEMRSWFDENRCEPLGFSRSGRKLDRLIYQVSFHDQGKARQFSTRFTSYAPTLRRPTLSERAELRAAAAARGRSIAGIRLSD